MLITTAPQLPCVQIARFTMQGEKLPDIVQYTELILPLHEVCEGSGTTVTNMKY